MLRLKDDVVQWQINTSTVSNVINTAQELPLPPGEVEAHIHLPGQSLWADKWLQMVAHTRMKVKRQETEIKHIIFINRMINAL